MHVTSTEQTTSTGPEIHTQRNEAAKPEIPSAETVGAAPGLPATRVAGAQALDVKMPRQAESSEMEQVIVSTLYEHALGAGTYSQPLEPDNFRSNPHLPSEPQHSDTPAKIMTVASASTHPAGGPSHSLHSTADSTALESESEGESAPKIPLAEMPSLVELAGSFGRGTARAMNAMAGLVPVVAMPKQSGDGTYKKVERPMNTDERTGLYVLGGVLGFGLIFGGPGRKKRTPSGH